LFYVFVQLELRAGPQQSFTEQSRLRTVAVSCRNDNGDTSMMIRTKILGTTIAAAAMVGAGLATPAAAAGRHHGWRDHHGSHHRMMRHTMRPHHMMHRTMYRAPRYVTGAVAPAAQYPQGYRTGYYENGFNPITAILGAAATIATAPLAIVTGGYPYGAYYG
jgi:hypothetical protein